MITPIVVGPICVSFDLLLFWLWQYWPSKWSLDQNTIPESDTGELQNSSMDGTNTNPFWKLLNFFSIPRRSWYFSREDGGVVEEGLKYFNDCIVLYVSN
jgi:hypothetical protein